MYGSDSWHSQAIAPHAAIWPWGFIRSITSSRIFPPTLSKNLCVILINQRQYKEQVNKRTDQRRQVLLLLAPHKVWTLVIQWYVRSDRLEPFAFGLRPSDSNNSMNPDDIFCKLDHYVTYSAIGNTSEPTGLSEGFKQAYPAAPLMTSVSLLLGFNTSIKPQ